MATAGRTVQLTRRVARLAGHSTAPRRPYRLEPDYGQPPCLTNLTETGEYLPGDVLQASFRR